MNVKSLNADGSYEEKNVSQNGNEEGYLVSSDSELNNIFFGSWMNSSWLSHVALKDFNFLS